MRIEHGRIDVHHHAIPPSLVAEMKRRGVHEVAGAHLPDWTPAKSIEIMNANGIQTAVTSVSAPGVYFGDKQAAVDLARSCNEFTCDMRVKHAGRFGSFAVLPMPFTDLATKEAIYALDVLKAEGIVLLGSTEGKFLGDPSFEELMAELNQREAVVFVHPNIHPSSEQLGLGTPNFIVEFLCDTTRAAVNLILTGTLEKYPRIRWILSHSGGFLPFIAWRVSLANGMPEFVKNAPEGIMTYIKRFYYDTALSPSVYSLAALRELVDPTHILFGSDYPFAPAAVVDMERKTLDSSPIWDESVKTGINRSHALALFPQFKQLGETQSSTPVFTDESLVDRGRRLLANATAEVVERIRDR